MDPTRVYDQVVTNVNDMESKKSFDVETGSSLVLLSTFIFDKPSFVDYLRSGVQVSLVGAVDYTASNGNPSNPQSLHYLGPGNQYREAISSCG
jgi:hypothetical protein